MEASILDLRYRMKKILQALNRNEDVKIFYHGKLKGILSSTKSKSNKKVQEHPFFGMHKDEKGSVEEIMNQLREGRYHAI